MTCHDADALTCDIIWTFVNILLLQDHHPDKSYFCNISGLLKRQECYTTPLECIIPKVKAQGNAYSNKKSCTAVGRMMNLSVTLGTHV